MAPTDKATTPNAPTGSLPVGSITCFAGDLSIAETRDALKAAGWLLCDGAELQPNEYQALFHAIGKGKNPPGEGRFKLPDLRDRFVRGCTDTATKGNADAQTRKPPHSGGPDGNRPGSLQESATALPVTTPFTAAEGVEHTHTVQHLNSKLHRAWAGSTYPMSHANADANTNSAGDHSHVLTGFDDATVPVNMTLYYIIKATEPASPEGTIPAGAMAAFAGDAAPAEQWLPCDGMSYATVRFPNLSAALSNNYGGDGVSAFNVPDLRGQFLRGTSHGTGRDPDARERLASNPGGATGDATGSVQGFATAAPSGLVTSEAGEHEHTIARIPQEYHNVADGASWVPLCVVWTDATTTSKTAGKHTHTVVAGGDRETRPVNVSVDWVIASDDVAGAPPIGSVVPVGSDITDRGDVETLVARGWLPCDGEKLKISDSKYSALYAVIGTIYGSAGQHFKLPDLRGYFIQGAGGKSKAGVVQNQSQTGKPVVDMVTSTEGSHHHTMPDVPGAAHVIDVVMGKQIAEWHPADTPTSRSGRHSHTVTGGDSESRPVNVNVDYVIRYR